MENTPNSLGRAILRFPTTSKCRRVSIAVLICFLLGFSLGLRRGVSSELSSNPTPAADSRSDGDHGRLVFEAAEGLVAKPFTVTNGFLYQTVTTTGVTNGGRVSYSFNLANAGAYVIQALVNAPDGKEHSFYVNIDAEPQDENMIWSLPVTAGFEERFIIWRNDELGFNDRPACKIFHLPQGAHQLIIRGKGANTQLSRLVIARLPSPPRGLPAVISVRDTGLAPALVGNR
jgi:hypothetical protein